MVLSGAHLKHKYQKMFQRLGYYLLGKLKNCKIIEIATFYCKKVHITFCLIDEILSIFVIKWSIILSTHVKGVNYNYILYC